MAQQRNPHRRRTEQLGHPFDLDGAQQGSGVGRCEHDAGRPQIQVRRQEAVELGAMEQRQRVHLDVLAAHLAVGDAAGVVRVQAARAQQRALRPRLGTAGVEQLHCFVVANRHVGHAGIGMLHPVLHAVPAGRDLVEPITNRTTHLQGQTGFGDRRLGNGSECVLDDHAAHLGVVEDVGDLRGIEHEVDRHHHCAKARQREADDHESVVVVRQQGDMVALGHSACSQRVGGAVHGLVEFGEGLAQFAVDQSGLARRARRAAPQQIAQPVAAGAGDDGIERAVGCVHGLVIVKEKFATVVVRPPVERNAIDTTTAPLRRSMEAWRSQEGGRWPNQ